MHVPCLPSKIPSSDVTIFEGHTSEVLACAWDPVGSLLASVSKDTTARIWEILDGPCGSKMQNGRQNEIVLEHCKGDLSKTKKGVTALDWNSEGTLLASASSDANTRIWSRNGELRGTSTKHKGPVNCLKWNKEGNRLLTGSSDEAIVWQWQMSTLRRAQNFEFHTGRVMHVDWRDCDTFATGSEDAKISVCKVGEDRPIRTFLGHKKGVNSIKWDESGSLLASCSGDGTVKIWSINQDQYIHDLKEHTEEVYSVEWRPTGPGTSNLNQSPILAKCIV
ncbi:WD40 repeat-containing protein HOS15-like [Papaver somniferum]|uniref:WD40 repeat-containing protein HOS15-like n=1 Tax=Papaver somniferum TaxID=3469 RepID=UPI000E6FE8B2|nr:WD40 repeat-containing protein HOS15-like [Papaver somniferum]XP_026411377.1 WD40 repeat-containing protein HOS15-like [Papaver somniferum]XP_026411378.1 WD40 repeat-containing protein HOS15-like [Papaver somniferum]